MQGSKYKEPDTNIPNDLEEEEDELGALVYLYAARRAQSIMKREGAVLVQAVRENDPDATATASQLLAAAVTKAIADAYSGDLDGDADANEAEP